MENTTRPTIVNDIIETCAAKGLMMKSSGNPDECEYAHVPISVFPTPYPLEHYQEAISLQPAMATMVADLVRQPHHIQEILHYFQEQDPFLKRLVDMSKVYNSQKVKQHVHLLILRSDYMLDAPTNSIKLVEYNTVASSLSSLCQRVREVQRYILSKHAIGISNY